MQDRQPGSPPLDPSDRDPRDPRDPVAGEAPAHPLAAGVGAAAGGLVAGAGVGSFAGPVGTAVGVALGALAGGLAGAQTAKSFDPHVEDEYWRNNYLYRPYVSDDASYDDYGPAYRYGMQAWEEHRDGSFDDAEADLERRWAQSSDGSRLDWARARNAARDAWHRVSGASAKPDADR